MTVYLTALTNDRAALIVKRATIENDPACAEAIRDAWEAEGYAVTTRTED